ncbi:hypothetical protein FOZ63_014590 [Perkinsus olseni]|uniref:Uncharacterized protein n=1 Tax=Perkinsus olseni TaxID=32597 RepID=A0A7J6R9H9_PEROL|nr:hypothetical protein FOZ62_023757 [Perkinsus olseni]KAF4723803.1 hypothetical protein FOZ63_014590 [Perkinsus olseni]
MESQINTRQEDSAFASYYLQLSELLEIDRHIEQLELNMTSDPEVQRETSREHQGGANSETKENNRKREGVSRCSVGTSMTPKEYHAKSTSSSAILEDEILRDIAAGTYRDVGKKRRLTRAPSCVPPDFNPTMESQWKAILSDKSSAYSGTKLVSECLETYQAHRVRVLDNCDADSPVPPLFNVSRGLADVWVRTQLKTLEAPNATGSYTTERSQAMADLAQSLGTHSALVTSKWENAVPQAVVPLAPQMASDGPAEVTAADKMLERMAEGEADDNHAQQLPETSRYFCKFCRKPMVYGQNDHIYTQRAWRYGRCPLDPKVAKESGKETSVKDEDEEAKQRRAKAREVLRAVNLEQDAPEGGKKRCNICGKFWTMKHEGLEHAFIGRGKIFCPYSDPPATLENYRRDAKERRKEFDRERGRRRRQMKR